jgi:hypothetical protein
VSRPLLLVAGILILLGLAWAGQGSGVIGGSAMSGSSFWLAVGVVLLLVGLGVVALAWFRRPKPEA